MLGRYFELLGKGITKYWELAKEFMEFMYKTPEGLAVTFTFIVIGIITILISGIVIYSQWKKEEARLSEMIRKNRRLLNLD